MFPALDLQVEAVERDARAAADLDVVKIEEGRAVEKHRVKNTRTRTAHSRVASAPRNIKLRQRIRARQDVFMTIKFRAVEATCRYLVRNPEFLES